MGSMLDLVGEDNIVWGSDYPHIDANIMAPELIRQSVAGLSEDHRTRILGTNAAKLFQYS